MTRIRCSCAVAALLCVATLLATPAWADRELPPRVSPSATTREVPALPLVFEPSNAAGTFVARSLGYSVAVGPDAARVYVAGRGVGLQFVNGRPGEVSGRGVAARANRLTGPVPSWRTDIPLYERVRRAGVWPGIDVEFYGTDRLVEYDFLVAPGADPRQIAVRIEEADGLAIDGNGDLLITVGASVLRQKRPVAYQERAGVRTGVEASYRLIDAHTTGITLGAYDRSQPLVIDPVLVFSTYLGGFGSEFWVDSSIAGVVVDASGRVIVVGDTNSTGNPANPAVTAPLFGFNPIDLRAPGTPGGERDVFVAILRADGTGLESVTYIGGSGRDDRASVALGPGGTIVVAGRTLSTNLLVSPGGRFYGGGTDGFVVVLNPTASAIVFSTYLGGTGEDSINDLAVAPSGLVVVAGHTESANFPTQGAGATSYAGARDGFVTGLSVPSGVLAFSTFLGGSGLDEARGVAVGADGTVFVGGLTRSSNFPTANGPQLTLRGSSDAFLAAINPATGARLASTYFGASGTYAQEAFNDVAVGPGGGVFAVGLTGGNDLAVVSAAQNTSGGGVDAMAVRFGWNGSALTVGYATYLGGSGGDAAFGVAVGADNAAHVVGGTTSANFPLVQPFDAQFGPSQDAFVATISPAGSSLRASSYYGGTAGLGVDSALAVAVDGIGDLYVIGQTTSTDLPVKAYGGNAAYAEHQGDADAFVIRISTDSDGDGLPDWWETLHGLDPNDATGQNGGAGDPDRDLLTNLAEFEGASNPFESERYFAEGATGTGIGFNTRFAILNPHTDVTVDVEFEFLTINGDTFAYTMAGLAPGERRTLDATAVPGVPELAQAEFSTVIRSRYGVVADRTMTWDATGYGSHAETSVAQPAPTWYLAEGATHSNFELFYLLQNPGDRLARVRVTYLRPEGKDPLVKFYEVPARSRFNIWVNHEQFPDGSGQLLLADEEISASIDVVEGPSIIVERAMYQTRPNAPLFTAGHNSAGTPSVHPRWFLAEGATGPYFDFFILIANPSASDTQVRITYLIEGQPPVVKVHDSAARSRRTIWVDFDDPALASVGVSAIVESLDGTGIVVERAMWWPGPSPSTWVEAHNSPGTVATGTHWALAEGEYGGPQSWDTYVLIANTSAFAGRARVTLHYEGGGEQSAIVTLDPSSRRTVGVGYQPEFTQANGKRFGVLVEALPAVGGTQVPQIVVERAAYSADPGGRLKGFFPPNYPYWPAGTNAVGTRVAPTAPQ